MEIKWPTIHVASIDARHLNKSRDNNKEVGVHFALNHGRREINVVCSMENINRASQNSNEGNLLSKPRSFVEAVSCSGGALPIKTLLPPRFESGNIIVEVDDEEYKKGVREY